jgi:hypothetical protein
MPIFYLTQGNYFGMIIYVDRNCSRMGNGDEGMKTMRMMVLVALIALVAGSTTYGWVSYYETSYYPAPVVVERVYAPPVVSYEPRVVEETSYIGTDWFSVGTTRERVVYDPVVYDPPLVTRRVYDVGYCPAPRTSVIIAPRHRTSVIVAPRCGPRRAVIIGGGHGGYRGGHHDGARVRVRH